MKGYKTLLKTELKLNIRDMNMLLFAIIMPIVITVILAVIYGSKPAFNGASYTFFEQSFGALCSISLCAGGLMGIPILISDYRQKKILKRFKVTPSSPVLFLGVQTTIYFIYALISAVTVYITSLMFGFHFKGSIIGFIGGWLLVMLCMFSIGLMVGGLAKDANQASIIASVLYFPMLIFSGATLPYEIMPTVMQKVCDIMPLTQGIKILKAASLELPIENIIIPSIIIIILAVLCIYICIRSFKWE